MLFVISHAVIFAIVWDFVVQVFGFKAGFLGEKLCGLVAVNDIQSSGGMRARARGPVDIKRVLRRLPVAIGEGAFGAC
jgi:hypothetical protein